MNLKIDDKTTISTQQTNCPEPSTEAVLREIEMYFSQRHCYDNLEQFSYREISYVLNKKIKQNNQMKYAFIEYMSYKLKKYGRKANSYLNALEEVVNRSGGEISEIIKKEQNVIPEDENINNNTEQDELTQNSEKTNIENVENSQVQTGVQVQDVTRNAIATKSTDSYNGVEIKNETSYELTDDILNPDININNKNIIIFHTHTCESYTSSEKYPYEPTGNYRTTDQNFSVVRVGDELEKYLTQYGFNVIHDKTYHDYPAYTGSYTRSQKTVENILNNNSSDIIIDLHRDAIGSNNNYAPAVKIGDETAARIMFVMGSNGGGLWHPNWQQNLKFAIKIQQKSNELYPGFAKPIMFRNSRYNQQLAKAACIIEVGSTGNTLEECLNSMKYLAFIMKEALK